MDQNKNHCIPSAGKFSQVHFLKKTIKILVSVSVFSLLFSQPSLVAGLLNYFDNYVSSFSIKFFDYKTERNYIFLLCNGILALIIKNSGLITNFQVNSSLNDIKIEKNQRSSGAELVKGNTQVSEDGEKEDENDDEIPEDDQIFGYEEEEQEEEEKEEQEEEEEDNELLSAEELNRKCDDFIKKMREGIRIDLQRSGLLVTKS